VNPATSPYELLVAPLAFGLAAVHAARALGAPRAAVELLSLTAFGFTLEWAAMRVFASHDYRGAWALAPLGVPIAVAAVWAAVILSALALAARLGYASPAARAAVAAALGIGLDLLMEPVAIRAGLWRWTPPGPWLGVPIGNFVGWAVLVGGWAAGAESWGPAYRGLRQMLARVALAAAVVFALIGVGFVWRTSGAERLFEGCGGWLAWAAMLFLVAALRRRDPALAPGGSLAARLAAAPGPLPSLTIALLLVAFTGDALRLGGPLAIVAAGSAVALAPALYVARNACGRAAVIETASSSS
jgi:uncharacterized membrane protein